MWRLERNQFSKDRLLVEESLFTTANGYLGVRGCFEEGYGAEEEASIRGTYINGLYDRVPIHYAEAAYGFPQVGDKQPRILDTQTCEIYLDGERVHLSSEQHLNYQRYMDYQTGIYTRAYDYKTKSGKIASIQFNRLASLWKKNHFIYKVSVSYDGLIKLVSIVDAGIENFADAGDPRVATGHSKLMNCVSLTASDNRVSCLMTTSNSGLDQATVVDYRIILGDVSSITNLNQMAIDRASMTHEKCDDKMFTIIEGNTQLGLEKWCTFTDQLRFENCHDKAIELADEAATLTYDDMLNYQKSQLDDYWRHSDIVIEGNEKHQSAIRFMLYQLLQSTGADEYSNVSAKGLSGEGYEGHYFWDTEIYILPVLQLTQPSLAKKLLEYRYHILPFAKTRALEMGHSKGAAYPWRTISGIECSSYFPAGTAQYHINADIAYAFIQYYLFNEDIEFLLQMGAEVVYETARIWLEIGNYHGYVFMINNVTGPDEYSAVVNNNYYTNVMAKYHLLWASKFYKLLSSSSDQTVVTVHQALCNHIGLESTEIEAMQQASESMYLPFNSDLVINPQDDAFLQKPIWPFENSKYPLLLNYHPLTIYRHQVLKQADTVLAHFLLEAYADETIIKNSFNYYEVLTTHDSSLSACVHGIMASRIGDTEKAFHYFEESIDLDLEDTHNNTKDGLHMANIAGTALSVISGFGGFRINGNGISFRPQCPKEWSSFTFKVKYQNREIEVNIGNETQFTLLIGEPIVIKVWGFSYKLSKTLRFSNRSRCLI